MIPTYTAKAKALSEGMTLHDLFANLLTANRQGKQVASGWLGRSYMAL